MAAKYPAQTYAPRTIANRPGITYDPADTKTLYKEDFDGATQEIVAIETELGANPKGVYASVAAYLAALASAITAIVIPTKATGAEINTGTDDAKFATPKAIKDSDIAMLSDIPTSNVTIKSSVTQTSKTSSTYADVDGSSQSVVISKASNVLLVAQIRVQNNTNNSAMGFRILRDSTVVAEQPDFRLYQSGYSQVMHLVDVEANLAAGTYTYKMQMKSIDNATTVYVVAASFLKVIQLT